MKAYLALHVQYEAQTIEGKTVKLSNSAQGIVGALFVFRTKTAARSHYGRNVELRRP